MKIVKMMVFVAVLLVACIWGANAQVLSIKPLPAYVISFQGTPQVAYELQASTNLVDWQGIAILPANVSGMQIYTNFPGNQAQLFYRTVILPAQANLSTDQSRPESEIVPVTDTVNGNYLGLPVLVFDINAQNNTLHIHNIAINFASSGTGAITAAYLYQGSTRVQSASVVGGVATFSDITDGTTGAMIPVGTTIPYTVKVDVTGVTAGSIGITASITTNNQVIYNPIDTAVPVIGSAMGNTITVAGTGPFFSLDSAPTILTVGMNNSGNNPSTSTIVASFPLTIGAVGEDVYFGTTASTAPAFLFDVIDSNGTVVYSGDGTTNGVISNSGHLANVKTVLPVLPVQVTNGVTEQDHFKVANYNFVSLGVIQFQFSGKDTNGAILTGGPYKVNLAGFRYQTNGYGTNTVTTTFSTGLPQWTTAAQNP